MPNAASAKKLVQGYADFSSMPDAVLALLDKADLPYAELAPGWFQNLQQTVFKQDPGVRYYVAARGSAPVAILPVRLARYGMVRRIEAFGNYYTSLYSPILSAQATTQDIANVLQSASQEHGGAHELRFAPMDADAPAFAMTLAALRSMGWVSHKYFCFGNWFLRVDADWQTYLASRSGALRSTLKRKGKRFAAAGGTLEIVSSADHAQMALAAYQHVYARSWKQPEPHPDFIPGLVRWLAGCGWLRMGIARLNGQPIAAQLWVVSHGRANIFKLAYDEAFAHFASGTLLTAHLLQHVIDTDKVQEVDYLIGDDPYKQQWMNQRRERWGIVATAPFTPVGFALTAREWLGHLYRLLRSRSRRSGGGGG